MTLPLSVGFLEALNSISGDGPTCIVELCPDALEGDPVANLDLPRRALWQWAPFFERPSQGLSGGWWALLLAPFPLFPLRLVSKEHMIAQCWAYNFAALSAFDRRTSTDLERYPELGPEPFLGAPLMVPFSGDLGWYSSILSAIVPRPAQVMNLRPDATLALPLLELIDRLFKTWFKPSWAEGDLQITARAYLTNGGAALSVCGDLQIDHFYLGSFLLGTQVGRGGFVL